MTRTPALVAPRSALNAAARRAAVGPRRTDGRRLAIRLWLPLTPLFLMLAPFALAGAAVGTVINRPPPARRRPSPSDLWSAKPTEGVRPPRVGGLRIAATRVAHPWRSAWAVGGVLLSLSGTLIEVETPAALIRLSIL